MSIKRCLFTVNDLTKGNYHTYYYNKLYWSFNISTCSSQNFLRASLKRLLGLATACSTVNLWYWLSLHPGFVSFWCCFTCIPSSKRSYKKEISDNFIVRHCECPCSKQQKKQIRFFLGMAFWVSLIFTIHLNTLAYIFSLFFPGTFCHLSRKIVNLRVL